MEKISQPNGKVQDYVGLYEKAIWDMVDACGSKEQANRLLNELHGHYEKTYTNLKKVKLLKGIQKEKKDLKKEVILEKANSRIHAIIEKHLPHTSDHIEELIIGTSLAVTAAALPAAHAVTALSVATGMVAIGGSYYIGFKLLRDWKHISGKHRLARFAGFIHPKHTKRVSKKVEEKHSVKAKGKPGKKKGASLHKALSALAKPLGFSNKKPRKKAGAKRNKKPKRKRK